MPDDNRQLEFCRLCGGLLGKPKPGAGGRRQAAGERHTAQVCEKLQATVAIQALALGESPLAGEISELLTQAMDLALRQRQARGQSEDQRRLTENQIVDLLVRAGRKLGRW